MSEIVDMCRHHKNMQQTFELDIDKWHTMDSEVRKIVMQGQWQYIKYFDDDGVTLSKDINKLPNDLGGIYIFVVQPDNIPLLHRYIMYIGRAQRKQNFSLRKRCRHYRVDKRIEVANMRETWGKDLYLYYLPLDTDEKICTVERELLRVVIPPCNEDIPDYNVMPKSAAF